MLASRTIHDGYRCNYLDALMRLYGQERALSPNTLWAGDTWNAPHEYESPTVLRIYKQLDVVPVNSLVIAVPITPLCFLNRCGDWRVCVCVFKGSDMNKSTSVCVSLIYTLSTKSPFSPAARLFLLSARRRNVSHPQITPRPARAGAPRMDAVRLRGVVIFFFFLVRLLHLSQFTLWGKLKSTVHQRTSVNQCAKALSGTVGFVFCRGFTINVCSRAWDEEEAPDLGMILIFNAKPSVTDNEAEPLGGSPVL